MSVWRSRTDLLAEVARDFPVRTSPALADAIADVDAVVVATATDQHVPIALEVLKAGRGLFIEKPLSHDWTGVENLRHLAEGLIVEIGCQFRAHPNLVALAAALRGTEDGRPLTYRLAMGHRLDAWRPTQDYRDGYSADATRGGGALFDLIHQIDIALWLFGPVVSVFAKLAKRGDLDIRADDVANVLLTHASGVTGHVQLDMASPVYRCEAEVMTNRCIFRWLAGDGSLRRQMLDGETVVQRLPDRFERNDLFLTHMAHFLERLENRNVPALCALDEGIAALRVVLGARESGAREQMIRFE